MRILKETWICPNHNIVWQHLHGMPVPCLKISTPFTFVDFQNWPPKLGLFENCTPPPPLLTGRNKQFFIGCADSFYSNGSISHVPDARIDARICDGVHTRHLLQTFSSADSRSLGPECSNGNRSFRPKLLSRSLDLISAMAAIEPWPKNSSGKPCCRVLFVNGRIDLLFASERINFGRNDLNSFKHYLVGPASMARYGYWKTGSGLFRLAFLEEAALKITFVRTKTLLLS